MRRPVVSSSGVAACVAVLTAILPFSVQAVTPLECAQAYEKAQVERKAGHFTVAIESLRECAGQECPAFVRKDCIQWMAETESTQPTVVFSVRRNGADMTTVEIACDGRVLTRSSDGKSVALDPGVHDFAFGVPGEAAVHRQIVIRQGERDRIVEIELDKPSLAALSPGAAARKSVLPDVAAAAGASSRVGGGSSMSGRRILAYSLAGLGTLGVSGFAAVGLWGYSQKRDFERSCAPFCSSSQVESVRTKYIVADACLGVGVVSLGLAAYLFLSEGKTAAGVSPSTTAVAISPSLFGHGAVVDMSGRF